MDLDVHTLMQDTDDFNILAGLVVEDHMPSLMIFAASLMDYGSSPLPRCVLTS
jgi:hypothetical protein